ncbi:MAG TPA: hypothetical protein VHZ75_00560 [Solirubrobacteraceae bacterium]|nr:hypothetical protein [Solirubrobacteraceae bacterium]
MAASVCALVAGLAAYAAVGGNSGSASVRAGSQILTIHGDVDGPLYPGARPRPIPVTLTNSSAQPIVVTALTVVLGTDGLPSGCRSTWFHLVQPRVSALHEVRVPARATITLPTADAPSVQISDVPTVQDACEGATLTLSYSGRSRAGTAPPVTPRVVSPADTADHAGVTATVDVTATPAGGARTRAAARTGAPPATRPAVSPPAAATAAVPAGDLLAIDIDGEPGIQASSALVRIAGKGLLARSAAILSVDADAPALASARADEHGIVSMVAALPVGLDLGLHHAEVRGTSAAGAAIVKEIAFTIASGDRLASVGRTPRRPFATLVRFEPAAHPDAVLAMTLGGAALLGALGAALGAKRPQSRDSREGEAQREREESEGPDSDGAFLEDVEVEREAMAKHGRGRGDRSRTWWWPFTRHLDHFAVHYPSRLAMLSAVLGRVSVDGDYLRAMFGSLTLLLYPAAVGLGVVAASSAHDSALPPSFAWFVAILALSIFDAMAGYVAGLSFAAVVILSGGVTDSPAIRELFGIVLVWFAVPLAAGAVRPLRRNTRPTASGLWDRGADFVLAGLFAGWVTAEMVEQLSLLSGYELPLAEQKWTISLVVLGVLGVRLAAETTAAHHYPDRLAAIRHRGELEPGKIQMAIALVGQMLLYGFVSVAYMKLDWPLLVGIAVFFVPLVPWLFADKLPKSEWVAKWMPLGLAKWAFVIVAGVGLSVLLERVIHDPETLENYGFVVLPIPILICWGLELFVDAEEEEEEEEDIDDEHDVAIATDADGDLQAHDGQPVAVHHPQSEDGASHPEEEAGRFPMTWRLRLAGVPVLLLCVYLILSGVAGG